MSLNMFEKLEVVKKLNEVFFLKKKKKKTLYY